MNNAGETPNPSEPEKEEHTDTKPDTTYSKRKSWFILISETLINIFEK